MTLWCAGKFRDFAGDWGFWVGWRGFCPVSRPRDKGALVAKPFFRDTTAPFWEFFRVEHRAVRTADGQHMNPIECRWILVLVFALVPASGCRLHEALSGLHQSNPPPQAALAQNPMYVPLSDREFLWTQLVDTVDDYFDIEREERVRSVGGVLTEGQLDTFPQAGATILEPWRKDSSPGFERRYATLQSIRRRAAVQVRPQVDGGYLVDLQVYKELEDVSQPEFSTVSLDELRHDGSLRRPGTDLQGGPVTRGWIPMGRDTMLEQRMLADLRGRLGVASQ